MSAPATASADQKRPRPRIRDGEDSEGPRVEVLPGEKLQLSEPLLVHGHHSMDAGYLKELQKTRGFLDPPNPDRQVGETAVEQHPHVDIPGVLHAPKTPDQGTHVGAHSEQTGRAPLQPLDRLPTTRTLRHVSVRLAAPDVRVVVYKQATAGRWLHEFEKLRAIGEDIHRHRGIEAVVKRMALPELTRSDQG